MLCRIAGGSTGQPIRTGQYVKVQVLVNCPAGWWQSDRTDIYLATDKVTTAASLAWKPVGALL